MRWLDSFKQTAATVVTKGRAVLAREPSGPKASGVAESLAGQLLELKGRAPKATGLGAADSAACESSVNSAYALRETQINEAVLGFFIGQGFIGYQICALLAQHWLISKACLMPARDAIRKGFEPVSDDGKDLPPELVNRLRRSDKKHRLNKNLIEFINLGRVFGIRIAFPIIESTDPNYYAHPFNPDGVTKGSFKGWSQVDPYWCSPELDANAAANPTSPHFYEPTFWNINGKKYHRSHLMIFRGPDVPDLLKPRYMYGGISVPQKIVERVYCAERTANEAPQLAMTKRQTVLATDSAAAMADEDNFLANLRTWVAWRDNFQVKVIDKDSEAIQQFDTTLAGFDDVIMGQYQLVAACSDVPATKLLGTAAKGLNATGEGDEANYHEELESIQTGDLAAFIERHWLLTLRSDGVTDAPSLSVNFLPLDTPTAKELAETNKLKAETGGALIASGAIDTVDERNRLRNDKQSGYLGLEPGVRDDPLDDPEAPAI